MKHMKSQVIIFMEINALSEDGNASRIYASEIEVFQVILES